MGNLLGVKGLTTLKAKNIPMYFLPICGWSAECGISQLASGAMNCIISALDSFAWCFFCSYCHAVHQPILQNRLSWCPLGRPSHRCPWSSFPPKFFIWFVGFLQQEPPPVEGRSPQLWLSLPSKQIFVLVVFVGKLEKNGSTGCIPCKSVHMLNSHFLCVYFDNYYLHYLMISFSLLCPLLLLLFIPNWIYCFFCLGYLFVVFELFHTDVVDIGGSATSPHVCRVWKAELLIL